YDGAVDPVHSKRFSNDIGVARKQLVPDGFGNQDNRRVFGPGVLSCETASQNHFFTKHFHEIRRDINTLLNGGLVLMFEDQGISKKGDGSLKYLLEFKELVIRVEGHVAVAV